MSGGRSRILLRFERSSSRRLFTAPPPWARRLREPQPSPSRGHAHTSARAEGLSSSPRRSSDDDDVVWVVVNGATMGVIRDVMMCS
jgi:hypothetical protein